MLSVLWCFENRPAIFLAKAVAPRPAQAPWKILPLPYLRGIHYGAPGILLPKHFVLESCCVNQTHFLLVLGSQLNHTLQTPSCCVEP